MHCSVGFLIEKVLASLLDELIDNEDKEGGFSRKQEDLFGKQFNPRPPSGEATKSVRCLSRFMTTIVKQHPRPNGINIDGLYSSWRLRSGGSKGAKSR
jgi:hypothetical protein